MGVVERDTHTHVRTRHCTSSIAKKINNKKKTFKKWGLTPPSPAAGAAIAIGAAKPTGAASGMLSSV
jgi:hypothetical protein